ncbi:MAG: hypothetical protein HQK65_02310 [Desulfamplus sp.]|nr:hypothetical protein [Desulfamplus sp.]
MFEIQEFEGKYYVIEKGYEWVADIRDNLQDAQLSLEYYNSRGKLDPPFPDLH